MRQELKHRRNDELTKRFHSSFRHFVISSSFLLTACGLQPLYGKQYQDSLAVDLSSVIISAKGVASSGTGSSANPANRRYSELLMAEIEDQTNPSHATSPKQYRLDIIFTEGQQGLFVKPDGTASRGNLIYSSQYNVTRLKDNKIIANGSLVRVSSFNSADKADYATYASIEDARQHGIMELAQGYKMRMAALLPTLNDPNAKEVTEQPKPPPAVFPQLQRGQLDETHFPGQ